MKNFVSLPHRFEENLGDFTPTEILVYIYLSRYGFTREDGYVEASFSFIANRYKKSRRSIPTAVLGLVRKGWIADIQHVDKDCNRYKINTEPSVNISLLKAEQARRAIRREIARKVIKDRDSKGKFVGSESVALGGSANTSSQGSANSPTQLNKELEKKEITETSDFADRATSSFLLDTNYELEGNTYSKNEDLSSKKRRKKLEDSSNLEDSACGAFVPLDSKIKDMEQQIKDLKNTKIVPPDPGGLL